MRSTGLVEQWLETFPKLREVSPLHMQLIRGAVQFPVLQPADVAYRTGAECPNYVMCISGRTRVFRISDTGREILIYNVGAGGTCVLTTQCLLSGTAFPAESTAEEWTELAALPRDTFHRLMQDSLPFRQLVLDDYSKLLAQMLNLVDQVAFAPLQKRLANRLLAEADEMGAIEKTHQQLALDLGTAREVVSRYLSEWEKAGWIASARGKIQLNDRQALAALR